MPENKSTPTPEVKKPDAAAKAPGTPPSTEQKPPAAPQAPQAPKAAAPAEKKTGDPPKEPPKAPPAPPTTPPPPPPKAPPKQPEEKGKAAEPKQAEVPKSPTDSKKPTVAEKPGEKKPDAKDAAPPPKAAAPTEPKEPAGKKPEEKKPDEKAPATDPKPKSATEPKKTDPKAAPGDASKGASAADPKKGETAPPTAESKGKPATDPKKPEDKAPAADPKGKPVDTPKKEDAKGPITVSGKDKVDIPIEPKGKAEDPKGAPAADPKKKDAAVEPPKGVKITQIFADRLDKPTQEDLKSLPIPQEGEGFSMRLHPAYFFEFLNHPFSVNRETDDYRELYDSIKENGINEPIKARPREGGGLELISGHRRHDVAMQLNYPVPVVIVQADNDSAQIECVDGNLHRKDIPTSELARAAKMKIEAMTRKAGRRTKMEKLTSPQKRTDQIVAEEMGYSRTQLTRLVRIDSLVPEMKQMVDSKKLPFNVAMELSYVVDETIYKETPTLLLGTVDKFAMLPFRPQAQKIFGYENGEKKTSPDLIIQDELHLISGPLGSMVGHYETLIHELCTTRTPSGDIHPKIIASTATISRAKEQCHALYGCDKDDVFQFPPSGLDAGNSFFAEEDRNQNGRRYVGILATGSSSDATTAIRLFASLLYGAKAMKVETERERDPYWTNMGYYNSIRELGQAATWIRADIDQHLDVMYKRRFEDKRFRLSWRCFL